jgi:hypothetical protein
MKITLGLIAICILAGCSNREKDVVAPQTQAASTNNLLMKNVVKGKRIYITKGGDNGTYLNGSSFSYNPGDTLVLKSSGNPYSYFSLEGFHGVAGAPVVIINEGGQVQLVDGFSFSDCSYLHLTGAGNKGTKYGFHIEDPGSQGVAVDIYGRSQQIGVNNVEIHNKTYGFWVKEDEMCADSLQFPNWVINHISLHDNHISRTNQEGMYLGCTDPNGFIGVSCNGVTIYPKPLRLGSITVYNNIIDSTNRSGIQLSGGDHGVNEIYNNTISNSGFELNANQGNGISLGGYTHANVYGNNIKNSYAMGIFCLGAGLSKIYNNTIANSGHLGSNTINGMSNIMIDTRITSPVDSTVIWVENNSLSVATDASIRLYATYPTYGAGNIFSGNTGTMNIVSGVPYSTAFKQP